MKETEQDEYEYYRTDDTGVMEAMRQRRENAEKVRERIIEFQKEYGVTLAVEQTDGHGYKVHGVWADKGLGSLPGRWKKPDRNGIREPYLDEAGMLERLRRIGAEDVTLTGMPELVVSFSAERWYRTVAFTHDGRTWAMVGRNGAKPDEHVWAKCERWEWENAHAAYLRDSEPINKEVR
jgi:hypothetical protein